jgi:hypothetical protein
MSLVSDWASARISDTKKTRIRDGFLRTPSARGMSWGAKRTPGGRHADIVAKQKLRDPDGKLNGKVREVNFQVHRAFVSRKKPDEILIRAREEFSGQQRPPELRNRLAEALAEEDRCGLGGAEKDHDSLVRVLYQ